MDELLKSGNHPSKILATEKWLDKYEGHYQKIDKSLINIVLFVVFFATAQLS